MVGWGLALGRGSGGGWTDGLVDLGFCGGGRGRGRGLWWHVGGG